MDFADRHVVVTGGAGALGSAVVGALVERGAVCHVPALTAEEGSRFVHRGHERVRVIEGVDLADEEAVRRVYARFGGGGGARGGAGERLWGSIHVAGGFDMGAIEDVSGAAWMKMIDMNATTCFLCCREAVRAMKMGSADPGDRGGAAPTAQSSGRWHGWHGGRIVNVAARPALRPEQGAKMVAYTASKAAVAAITGALAAEVLEDGILVNAVAPSIMDTPANRAAMPKADHAKWPKVEEVAGAIVYLASPGNAVTSGAVVPVYGRA